MSDHFVHEWFQTPAALLQHALPKPVFQNWPWRKVFQEHCFSVFETWFKSCLKSFSTMLKIPVLNE